MKELICGQCNVPLEPSKTMFSYLGYDFNEVLPRCPKCGQIFLDEAIVRGKMQEAETEVEDK